MKIIKPAIAGTLESSDAQVRIEPNNKGIEINIESSVIDQYGDQIKESVEEVLSRFDVDAVTITINDKGALDCTIRSRVETALLRSVNVVKDIAWGEMIK